MYILTAVVVILLVSYEVMRVDGYTRGVEAENIFYYSVAIAVWIMIILFGVAAVQIIRLIKSIQANVERVGAMGSEIRKVPQLVKFTGWSIITKLLRLVAKGGDK